jgi:hypothetical protein
MSLSRAVFVFATLIVVVGVVMGVLAYKRRQRSRSGRERYEADEDLKRAFTITVAGVAISVLSGFLPN